MTTKHAGARAGWASVLFSFVALTPEAALAQGADAELRALLDENVVTTASKSAQQEAATPAVSTSITAEELRRHGIHSLDEAIDFLSLGLTTANPLLDVEVGARGVLLTRDRGNHLLLLVNGHAVNEPLYGSAQFGRGAGVPFELIDHIEMVVGPGSVLYGSNAMLGVINVITKRAKDFPGTHAVVESEIGKSYRAAAGAGYKLPFLGPNTEVTLQLEYYRQSGPTFTLGPQALVTRAGSEFRTRRNGPADGVWGGEATESYYATVPSALIRFVSGNFELNLNAATYKRSSPAAAFYSPYDGDFNDPENFVRDRRVWGDAKYTVRLSPVVQLTSRVYGDAFDQERVFTTSTGFRCYFTGTAACLNTSAGVSAWGGAELQTAFNWLHDSSLVTLVGLDGRTLGVRSKADVRDADTLEHKESSSHVIRTNENTLGAYLQQTWNPVTELAFNGGVRMDVSERHSPVLSPRLAANFGVWKGGTLKLIFGEAFRAPSWNELLAQSPTLVLADGLKPERVRSVEALIEQRLGAQRILFGVFQSHWTNLIELHRLTEEEMREFAAQNRIDALRNFIFNQYRNVSEVDAFGWNGRVEGAIGPGRFRYAINGTAALALQTDPTVGYSHPPTVAPSLYGNARISYDLGGSLPTLALAGYYKDRRPATQAFHGGFVPPPYAPAQVELRATVSGPLVLVPGLSYRASIDYAFASQSPYVVGPVQEQWLFPTQRPLLGPVDQFRATLGLQYDFAQ